MNFLRGVAGRHDPYRGRDLRSVPPVRAWGRSEVSEWFELHELAEGVDGIETGLDLLDLAAAPLSYIEVKTATANVEARRTLLLGLQEVSMRAEDEDFAAGVAKDEATPNDAVGIGTETRDGCDATWSAKHIARLRSSEQRLLARLLELYA